MKSQNRIAVYKLTHFTHGFMRQRKTMSKTKGFIIHYFSKTNQKVRKILTGFAKIKNDFEKENERR